MIRSNRPEVTSMSRSRGSTPIAIVAALVAVFLSDATATAQEAGQSRIQGQAVPTDQVITTTVDEAFLDFREEMRTLVTNVSKYAHGQNPNFIIIPKGNLDLLTKIDDVDETKSSPARAYMLSIDAVIADGLFFGAKAVGEPTAQEILDQQLRLVEVAQQNRLKVLAIDYVDTAAKAAQSYDLNLDLGTIPFVAPAKGEALNAIPDFRATPINENPKSILSLTDVRNFLYLGSSAGYGRQDEYALKMHGNNFDMLIVDVFHGRRPLSRQAVETLKYKKIGARRLVLAYVDIASAASYHYYWQPNWREGSPSWIGGPHRDNPDKYYVQYWNPAWQGIIFGNPNSFIYGLIAQGFDGAVLEGLETYKYFLGGGEGEQEQ